MLAHGHSGHHSALWSVRLKHGNFGRQVRMKTLALVVDERELSTIEAALLLLQEQISALPEDLSEMMSEHGAPLTEAEVEKLVRRITVSQRRSDSSLEADVPRAEMLVEIETTAELDLARKRPA
jgi:hypothetical protein